MVIAFAGSGCNNSGSSGAPTAPSGAVPEKPSPDQKSKKSEAAPGKKDVMEGIPVRPR